VRGFEESAGGFDPSLICAFCGRHESESTGPFVGHDSSHICLRCIGIAVESALYQGAQTRWLLKVVWRAWCHRLRLWIYPGGQPPNPPPESN
jgi:hypothetical protein